MKPTAIIVDDEPLARRKLRELVAAAPLVELIGEADDGESAIACIDERRPDIVFLDIEMPPPSGLEVVSRVRHSPAVIFTTGFDRYAVAAFELAAVDYLLKPFGLERFRLAVERAAEAVAQGGGGGAERALEALDRDQPLRRLFVRTGGRILPVPVESIERFEARDDYVALHTGGRAHLIRATLRDLEARLDPDRFVRIHRSHIVNLDFVKQFTPYDSSRLTVELRDGDTLQASRSYSQALRRLAR